MLVRKLLIKYIINIVVHFVGYLYIIDLFNARKMENIKTMKFILGNQVNVIIPIKQNTLANLKFKILEIPKSAKVIHNRLKTDSVQRYLIYLPLLT
jgi:hypothetical protein